MTQKPKHSLGIKFSLLVMGIGMLISFLIMVVGYQIYYGQILDRYAVEGAALLANAAKYVDWEKIDDYLADGQTDDEYSKTLAHLRMLREAAHAEYIYILVPDGRDAIFVLDTDESEDHMQLGEVYEEYYDFAEHQTQIALKATIGPIITSDEYGRLVSFYMPYFGEDGEFLAYIAVDYDGEYLMEQQWEFMTRLIIAAIIITVIMTAFFMLMLRRMVLQPINSIVAAASNYIVSEGDQAASNSIARLNISTRDELQSLTEALKTMGEKIRHYIKNLEIANRKAESDTMTKLLNRESFVQEVDRILKNAEEPVDGFFMMIDIDYFKKVNDNWGHAVGDDVIIACARAIKLNFRTSDLVARTGGDEFAVFAKGTWIRQDVERRAENICQAVRQISVPDGLKVTVSIGVAMCSEQIASHRELYIEADLALYEAKAAGRNRYSIR